MRKSGKTEFIEVHIERAIERAVITHLNSVVRHIPHFFIMLAYRLSTLLIRAYKVCYWSSILNCFQNNRCFCFQNNQSISFLKETNTRHNPRERFIMEPQTAQEQSALEGELSLKSRFSCHPDKYVMTGNKCTTFKRNLSCCQCGKVFTTKSKLNCHEKIHTGNKPFICSKCDYQCSRPGHLKTHKRIHTDEKPYSMDHIKCFEDPWKNPHWWETI